MGGHGIVFPAHAGMNREQEVYQAEIYGVPRTRGDEPSEKKENETA